VNRGQSTYWALAAGMMVTLGLELMLHLVLLRSAEHATAALVYVIVLATEALETVGMQIIDQVKSLCCTGQSYWTTKKLTVHCSKT
jgi:hypothetical protein